MSTPRTFISFDFHNNETEKNLFAGMAKNSRTPFELSDWSSKEHLPHAQWEALIDSKIAQTNMVIVLVGLKTYTAVGVIKEIQMAADNNVPVFGVFVGGANTVTPLPTGLPANRVIGWNWDNIAAAIKQLMGEGKNAA